ncbi:hypothetical protein [Sphaerisporangium perillae]|uniref:hypothetical protein n=1 Tax=Sphaerisporangium perillae TaxID=2935860 RepID=UPI00200BF9C0|nr:hypothetical protein [Sphaerisporangium perillae]
MERRDFFRFTGGVAGAALLTSCTSGPGGTRPSAAARPVAAGTPRAEGLLLYADVSAQVSAIDAQSGATLFSPARPVPAAGWERLHTVSPAGELLTLDARTGAELFRTTIPPGLVPRVVSSSGNVVALTAPPPASPYGKPGRRTTTMVVADPSGQAAPRTLRLDGNFEPDGFSPGGDALYVLQYLPATAPDSYRVRVYDLEEGKLWPLLTRDKQPVPEGAEETMRGDGRAAVLDPGHQRLYTLYTHQPDHLHTRDLVAGRTTGVHAFVHVLDLGQRWAYCLDLPEPFGRGPAEGHTLAVSADALYVYEDDHRTLIRASTESLTILDTTTLVASSTGTSSSGTPSSPSSSGVPSSPSSPGTPSSPSSAGSGTSGGASAVAAGDHLYIAAGPSVRSLDPYTLALRREWRLPGPAMGVAVTPDEAGLYVGVADGVLRFDVREGHDGGEPGRLAVPGITRLRHVATRPYE